MNSKKILIIAGVVVAVLIAGALLWKGVGTESIPPSGGGTTVTPQTGDGGPGGETGGKTVAGDASKVTDEMYIEVLAQSSNPQMKDMKTWAADMKALYAEYGVTEADIKAYASELEKDPLRAGEIGQKYMKRAMELRNTGK